MKHISQATIRQFLQVAAVALALGNEVARADGVSAMPTASTPPTGGNSSRALASDIDSERELQIPRSQRQESREIR
ncbi:MAG: hypothetical protein KDH15_14035 [Rhodocyclaceae bacterium]|nr:hypothetical protein [Rhodocyclaceae bacterium]